MPANVEEIIGKGVAEVPAIGNPRIQPYLRNFGLNRNPFPVVPDANGFFLSPRNETIVAEILHVIESRKGFMVITGEVGLGKTTISRRLLSELEDRDVQTALVFNTFHQGAELLNEINKDFGVTAQRDDLQSQMSALNLFLLNNLAKGINCAIIIDDAQQLSIESLELVRQISNLETGSEKLVQILLIGQPELDTKLNRHELRQLASRITLKHLVKPYSLLETKQYVQFKLAHAGGQGRLPLTSAAFRLLQKLSKGNPRQINYLMDRCLYACIAYGSNKITRGLLAEASRDVHRSPIFSPRSTGKLIAQSLVLVCLLVVLGLLILNPMVIKIDFSRLVDYSPMSVNHQTSPATDPKIRVGRTGLALKPNDNQVNNNQAGESTTEPVVKIQSDVQIVAGADMDVPASNPPIVNQEFESPVNVTSSDNEQETRIAQDSRFEAMDGEITFGMQSIQGSLKETLVATPPPSENLVPDTKYLHEIEPFLQEYNLVQFATEFESALTGGWTDGIAEEIALITQLRLVELSATPEGIKLPILEVPESGAEATRYLLFWRPELWTPKHFYYFYRDTEVVTLQGALRQAGFFDGEIDGLVGPVTTNAVRRFQTSVELPATGRPDTQTLFLLERKISVISADLGKRANAL